MKTRKGAFLILVLSALYGSISSSAFCSDEERYGEFYKAANEKWAEYIDDISRMECSVVLTTSYHPNPESKTELNLVFDYPYYAVETTKDGVIENVSCFGKKYSFKLKRNPETDSFDIISLKKNELDIGPQYWKDIFFSEQEIDMNWLEEGGSFLRYNLGQELILWGLTTFPKLIQYDDFSIDSFSEDTEKIYVDYKLEPEGNFDEKSDHLLTPVRSGHFVLHRNSFLVESAEFFLRVGKDELQYELSYDYGSTDDNTFLKKKTMVARKVNDDSFVPHTTIFEYSNNEYKRQPLSRFKLSYYGLPEPRFESIGFTLWRVFFTLLGCALIAYALFTFYRRIKSDKKDLNDSVI